VAPTLMGPTKTQILRGVDQFVMSLPLGTAPGDAQIEEAVASRLYKTELERAELQAKLEEWCVACLWGMKQPTRNCID
jgi:hypothetical protein